MLGLDKVPLTALGGHFTCIVKVLEPGVSPVIWNVPIRGVTGVPPPIENGKYPERRKERASDESIVGVSPVTLKLKRLEAALIVGSEPVVI